MQVNGLLEVLEKISIPKLNELSDPLDIAWIVVRFSCVKILQPNGYLKVGRLQVKAFTCFDQFLSMRVDCWVMMLH